MNIDLVFLEKFSAGIIVSILLFFVVELVIRTMKISNHRQKSHLYMITFVSCFSSIFYTTFFFNIDKYENKLIFSFLPPRVMFEPQRRLPFGMKEGFTPMDLRLLVSLLIFISLAVFLLSIFLSKFYMKKRLNLKECEDTRVIDTIKKICQETKMEIPEILIVDGMNAFVFGVPPALAVGRELVNHTDENELELVLRHEMNHIRNHDNILKPLFFSLQILFFFNPVSHILNQRIAREREFLADNVSEVKKDKILFLYTLVKLNELQIGKKTLFCIASSPLVKPNLKMRTETLLSENRSTGKYPYFVALWVFAILLVAGLYVPSNFAGPREGLPDGMAFGKVPGKMWNGENILGQYKDGIGPIPGKMWRDGGNVLMRQDEGLFDVLDSFPPMGKEPAPMHSIDLSTLAVAILVLPLLVKSSEYGLSYLKWKK
ncbi:MAG: M56 family metallopeptidase [Theionarchaea archaeon]|nr:M56 family metallopeptidase [Theionarchaea archaeon]